MCICHCIALSLFTWCYKSDLTNRETDTKPDNKSDYEPACLRPKCRFLGHVTCHVCLTPSGGSEKAVFYCLYRGLYCDVSSGYSIYQVIFSSFSRPPGFLRMCFLSDLLCKPTEETQICWGCVSSDFKPLEDFSKKDGNQITRIPLFSCPQQLNR